MLQILFTLRDRKRHGYLSVVFAVVLCVCVCFQKVESAAPLNELSGNSDQILFDDDVLPGPTSAAVAPASLENPPESAFLVKTSSDFRLPTSIVPISYRLQTRPILDEAEGQEQHTCPSKVWIQVECVEDTDRILLHSLNLNINQGLTEVQ